MGIHFQSVAFHRSPGGSGLPGPAGPPPGPRKVQPIASNFCFSRCQRTGAGGALGAAQRRPGRWEEAACKGGTRSRRGAGGLHGARRLSGSRTPGQQGSRAQEPKARGSWAHGDPRVRRALGAQGPEICGARRAPGERGLGVQRAWGVPGSGLIRGRCAQQESQPRAASPQSRRPQGTAAQTPRTDACGAPGPR